MTALTLEKRENGVAVVTLDVPGTPVNVLSSAFLDDFRSTLDRIEEDPEIHGCVLTSAKKDNFIAGADLREVLATTTSIEAEKLSRTGHVLLDRIEASEKPFVAAIHGAALGGGLEVALACHYRIASRHPKTVLGLPEVMLGLLPAAGGTQRLPRLVSIQHALPLLLTGQRVRSAQAFRIGLIDAVTVPEDLLETAIKVAWSISAGKLPRERRFWLKRLLLHFAPVRSMIIRRARQAAERKTRGLYPAPAMILDCVETGFTKGYAEGQKREIESFGKLVISPQAKNLVWLFHASNEMKKLPAEPQPLPIRKLGVLGGGLMGEGIASVSLPLNPVVVKDVSVSALAKVSTNITRSLDRRVETGSLQEEESARQKDALVTTTEESAMAGCDLVIEAVFEDLELKRSVLSDTEAVISEDAVFASNTSALPIRQIAVAAKHPGRVVGMHYFSPVPKMPLLEVVVAPETTPRTAATAQAYGIAQGKTVIVVKDGPGFYTTRILAPYLNEAILLLEEGADICELDSALKDFGYPVGPVALLDEVGIDVAAHVSHDLGEAFAERGLRGSNTLEKLFEAGYRGRKNRRGFFVYESKKKGSRRVDEEVYRFFGGPERKPVEPREMIDRLVLMMVNEAVHCLADGTIASPRDGDVGAVMGLGFPPFLGGPFHYVDAVGPTAVVQRMDELSSRHGRRFTPATMLREMVSGGRRFY